LHHSSDGSECKAQNRVGAEMPDPVATPAAAPAAAADAPVGAGARRRARQAVAATFAANGVLVGSWAPRIPEIKTNLGLSAAALGFALLAPALGTVLAARTVGARSARHGSGSVTRACAVAYCLTAWLPAVAPNLALLWVTLLGWGALMGAMDVSMNAQGVTVEAAYGRPVLAGFHAVWSLASFTGAVLGGLGAALGVPVGAQQAGIGLVAAITVAVVGRSYLPDPPREPAPALDARPPRERRLPRTPELRLVLLGLSAVFALMAEGAVADWSGVLLRDHLGVTAGRVGVAYAAFCVTMTGGRLAGDRVVHALGRARCFAALALIGAMGLAAGLATDTFPATVAGFAALGLGLSIMVPVLFSTAADTDGPAGPAIAAVSALGCVGLLVGPSLIGLIAQGAGVRTALLLLVPFTLAAGALGVAGIRATRSRE
jgi:predicted MFS family arabinose efflux permease